MNMRAICVGAVVLAASAALGQTVRLERKYLPGNYLLTQQTRMQQDISSGSETAHQEMTMRAEMLMQVSEPDAQGNTTMRLRYRNLRQTMNMAGRTLVYDSADPDRQAPELAGTLEPLVSAEIIVTIDGAGNVVRVRGMDEIWDRMAQQNPQFAQTAAIMKQQMGNQTIRHMLDRTDQMLPQEPVAQGDRWKSQMTVTLPFVGELTYEQDSRLEGIRQDEGGQVAMIAYTARITTSQPKTTEMDGTELTVQAVDLRLTGTAQFDVAMGQARSETLRQEGQMRMSVPGEGGEPQTMTVDQNMSVESELREATAEELAPASAPVRGEREPTR